MPLCGTHWRIFATLQVVSTGKITFESLNREKSMSDKETISVYDDQVENYAGFFTGDDPGAGLKEFAAELPDGGRFLDLGCGPANWSAWMRDQGLDVDAVDASPEIVRFANETHNLNARVGVFDDLDAVSQYDGVWANFSLLHATRADFPRHLKQINTALKSGGYFHIGMKLGNDADRDHLGRFYTYYSESELKTLLEEAGFEILTTKTGEEKGLAGNIDPFILILMKKST